MKYLSVIASILFSGASFAQVAQRSAAITMSPFATATRVVESGIATITAGIQTAMAPFATTIVSIENRGVAGKEQLRDEMVALDRDMKAGVIQNIADIQQASLKELFEEIAADDKEMERINTFFVEGNEVTKIATLVTLKLFY